MTQSQLTFPSVTPILTWAGTTTLRRMDDEIVYVFADGTFYYFGKYAAGYVLLMTSQEDITEEKD